MTTKPQTEVRYGHLHRPVTAERSDSDLYAGNTHLDDTPAPTPEPSPLLRYAAMLAATPKEDERADSDQDDDAAPKPLSYFERYQLDQAREAADAEWQAKYEAARQYLKSPVRAAELDANHVTPRPHPALDGDDNG